jgi:signal transduction histidine kinase
VTIEDNGCGFDVAIQEQQRSDRGGLGLAGMRERVSLVGGEFEVESSLGGGTVIFVRIPFEPKRTAA